VTQERGEATKESCDIDIPTARHFTRCWAAATLRILHDQHRKAIGGLRTRLLGSACADWRSLRWLVRDLGRSGHGDILLSTILFRPLTAIAAGQISGTLLGALSEKGGTLRGGILSPEFYGLCIGGAFGFAYGFTAADQGCLSLVGGHELYADLRLGMSRMRPYILLYLVTLLVSWVRLSPLVKSPNRTALAVFSFGVATALLGATWLGESHRSHRYRSCESSNLVKASSLS